MSFSPSPHPSHLDDSRYRRKTLCPPLCVYVHFAPARSGRCRSDIPCTSLSRVGSPLAFPSALSSKRNGASGDLPDGHAAQNPVQSSSQEYSASRFAKISIIESDVASHKRGVSRSSRTLSTGCDGRRAPGAIIARTSGGLRTVKSCGPGAPTLALSFAGYPRSDGGKKARSQEHEENR
jgi:hypothetical protein